MNEETFRMITLAGQGFYCSQVLLFMGLEAQGKSNPDLIRAMAGTAPSRLRIYASRTTG